jgi:DNA-binding FrmR family transcriptional regulator
VGLSEKDMDDITKKAVTQRLSSAAGHIKGIERMVQEDTYCIDVIKQVQAVQAALNKVSSMILDNHLHTCVTTAIRNDEPDERERVLEEITSVFTMSNKI